MFALIIITMVEAKVTTKVGDKGKTFYKDGEFISKGDDIIEFFGCIDELQVALGGIDKYIDERSKQNIVEVQKKLFDIYSEKITFDDVDKIELWQKELMDKYTITYDWNLTTPKTLNIDEARVRARKTERAYHRCKIQNKPEATMKYLNRLSDYLWTLGRSVHSVPKGKSK